MKVFKMNFIVISPFVIKQREKRVKYNKKRNYFRKNVCGVHNRQLVTCLLPSNRGMCA